MGPVKQLPYGRWAMARINHQPSDMWGGPPGQDGFPFHHAVVEPAGRRVHVTGQVAWDAEMNVMGIGDPAVQTHAALDNIVKVLSGLGGSLDDIVAMTTYYLRDEDYASITAVRADRLSNDFGPATTGIRVAGLVAPDLLVEITATAVIPEARFTAG